MVFGATIYLKHAEVNYLADQGGMIVEREEWEKLKEEVELFFSQYTDDQISAHNQKMLDSWKNEYNSMVAEKPKTKGYVYFVLADNGRMKIGKTTNLESRFNALVSASANQLELIAYVESEDYSALESEIHCFLSQKRTHGEWFEIEIDDIENVENAFELEMVYVLANQE